MSFLNHTIAVRILKLQTIYNFLSLQLKVCSWLFIFCVLHQFVFSTFPLPSPSSSLKLPSDDDDDDDDDDDSNDGDDEDDDDDDGDVDDLFFRPVPYSIQGMC